MANRTLIHMAAGDSCIRMQTYSRSGKSPHWFYVLRSRLAELEKRTEVVVRDIHSFAVFHRDADSGSMDITFTWLDRDGDSVSGRQETVILPYGKFSAFLRDSAAETGPSEWKALSVDHSGKRPGLVFKSRKNLHAALGNGAVRRKLVRILRDGFNWPSSERIVFRDDFLPYSFAFQEIRGGEPAISGGLILHGQEDLKKAYYSIHT